MIDKNEFFRGGGGGEAVSKLSQAYRWNYTESVSALERFWG